jgi:hypothetical protein
MAFIQMLLSEGSGRLLEAVCEARYCQYLVRVQRRDMFTPNVLSKRPGLFRALGCLNQG